MRDWEEDKDFRDFTMDLNAAQGVKYGWDCSTSRGYGDDGETIKLDDEEDDAEEEDDTEGVQLVDEGGDEMLTCDIEDMEDVETKKLDKDLYPPPPSEDPEIIKRMERRKELSSE